MADLIERADAINAIRYVTDSPNYSKTLGELLRIPSVEQNKPQTDVYEYQNGEWVKPDCPWK